jgi:hypothetical protein
MSLVVVLLSLACVAAIGAGTSTQDRSSQRVLAVGESWRMTEPDVTLTFEGVGGDSRCPTGAECVWEGDATVRLRVEAPGAPATSYVLHTNDGFQREFEHGKMRVRLVGLAPHPVAGTRIAPSDYRATVTTGPV